MDHLSEKSTLHTVKQGGGSFYNKKNDA